MQRKAKCASCMPRRCGAHRTRGEVFGGDEFQPVDLAGLLILDDGGDLRVHLAQRAIVLEQLRWLWPYAHGHAASDSTMHVDVTVAQA